MLTKQERLIGYAPGLDEERRAIGVLILDLSWRPGPERAARFGSLIEAVPMPEP